MPIFNWYSSKPQGMRYIHFDIKNPRCLHCMISDRAYASIITEVMTNNRNETGGVLLGYIFNRTWYIVESLDPGMDTVNQEAFFQWDNDYVNHQAQRLSKIYRRPPTILGFWHRHPGSMDYFSGTDEDTIQENLRNLKLGLLSMLVNIDPELRMTFYYCYGNDIMKIKYDVGNKYFPAEFLEYANATELSNRGQEMRLFDRISYTPVINLESVMAKKANNVQQTPPANVQQTPPAKNSTPAENAPSLDDKLKNFLADSLQEMKISIIGKIKEETTVLDARIQQLETLIQERAETETPVQEAPPASETEPQPEEGPRKQEN